MLVIFDYEYCVSYQLLKMCELFRIVGWLNNYKSTIYSFINSFHILYDTSTAANVWPSNVNPSRPDTFTVGQV